MSEHPLPDADAAEQVLNRDAFTCQLCGSCRNLEVHHIRPRSRMGTNALDNLLTLCHACHQAVHAGFIRLKETADHG